MSSRQRGKTMANDIQTQRDLYGTFLRWAREGRIPDQELPHKASGEYDGPKVVAYVLSHSHKFSAKIQKEIEVLKKAFALLGFAATDIDKLLVEAPGEGANRLLEKGKELEAKAKSLPQGGKDSQRSEDLAEKSYRLALQMDGECVAAHRALSDLLFRRHAFDAARHHAAAAVRRADPKDLFGMVGWLQSVGDSKIDSGLAVNFVANELVSAKRYGDAKALYEAAAHKAEELEDKAVAKKFLEKALVAGELEKPYRLGFTQKNNPQALRLYEALRAEGVPSGLLEAKGAQGDRLIEARELFKFVDENLSDSRVQKALHTAGMSKPPWLGKHGTDALVFTSDREQSDFEALGWSEKISFYHAQMALRSKKPEDRAAHLAAAAHFGASSAEKNRQWAEFLLAGGKTEQSAAVYEAVVALNPKNADDRKTLGELYLKLERWEEACAYLPSAEAQAVLMKKAEDVGAWVRGGDLPRARILSDQVSKALAVAQGQCKKNSEEAEARFFRVQARLDLARGDLKAAEGDTDAARIQYQSSLAANEKVLGSIPQDPIALLQRAESFERLGMFDKAMADYQVLLKVSPGSLSENYTDFRGRYQEKLRSDFKAELEQFKRLSFDKNWKSQIEAFRSMGRLSVSAETLRKFPALSSFERFENQKLVRQFYQFRVQFWESKSLLAFTGAPVSGNIMEATKQLIDQKESLENHADFLNNIGYSENLLLYKQDVATVEAEMRQLRDEILPSLELKSGEGASIDQVENARVVVSVDRELGYYAGLAGALDHWKALVDALPPYVMDSSYRVDVYGQILLGWKAVRAIDEEKYPLGLPKDAEVTMKMADVYYGTDFKGPSLKSAVEAYTKSQGLPWDEKAFREMYSQMFVGDETQDARFGKFVTPKGIKAFFEANQQAKSFMNQAGLANGEEDYLTSRSYAVQALKIYAQLGNELQVKETIEYLEDQQLFMNIEGDTTRSIDTLDLQMQMLEAVRGSGMTADIQEGRASFEDVLLEKARRSASSLIGNDYSYNSESIRGMMAARNFFELTRDQESINEIDKNLKEHQSTMSSHIQFLVDSFETGAESEMRVYGPDFSMYSADQRRGQINEAAALLQTDMALLATKDISKEEVRKELGKQLMQHADLWRRLIAANPDLPVDFRLEQVKQLASTLAMFKKSFTEGDAPILQTEALKAPTEAVGGLTSSILKEGDFLFFPALGGNQDWAIQEMRQHGLGSRLENGILGYYLDRGSDTSLKALNKDDWAEIERIKTNTLGNWSMAEPAIERYLLKVGKFRELSDDEIAMKDSIATDFQTRLTRAISDGDSQFLGALNPGFIRGFAQADVQAHEILVQSRDEGKMPALEERLEKCLEAAQAFGQLGIESRMEEALAPVKAHVEKIEDPTVKASGYYSLAQLYEMAGMDSKAKDYLSKLGAMDPGVQAEGQKEKSLHEMAVFSLAKIQLADGKLQEAKKLLATIPNNSLAKEYLEKLDAYEEQRRVAYPLEFLSAVLTAETDSKRGSSDDLNYLMNKKDKVDQEQRDNQAFLNEVGRLVTSGECASVQEAMDKLRGEPRYFMIFYFLENTGRGKDSLGYIRTLANPSLNDEQMSGETLRLAEKLLSRDDFDFSMNVAAPLMRDPYIGKQATKLVKDRIPDAAKWAARKKAIWGAIKDILIVPAIVEGRYKDAAISAIITICSFGVGRVASAGAKMAWAGFTARSLARAGWIARFAAWSPRAFRVAEVVVVAAADNAGFTVGGMLGETAVTGENQFGWDRFKHEMLLGMAPFGLVHFSGKAMGAITKRAEHLPWMKVANEAEAALLRQEGKAVVSRGWRAALWGSHRLMNASAFTLGGLINQGVGLAEKDATPLALMFLQNIAMDLQMTAAHAGVNRLTGGKLEHLDRRLDRELYLAPALAKLKVNPSHPAGQAMSGFVLHYADALAAQRGKALSSAELAKELSHLNVPVEAWLKGQNIQGASLQSSRLQMFRIAAERGWKPETLAEFLQAMPEREVLDRAVDSIFKGDPAGESRDALKGLVASWALGDAAFPKEFSDRLKTFSEISPDIGNSLRAAVNELLGPKGTSTAAGRRLMSQFFLRMMAVAEGPEAIPALARSLADLAPKLRDRMDYLLAANQLSGNEASLAMTDWVLGKGLTLESLDHFIAETREGKTQLTVRDGQIELMQVSADDKATRKAAVEEGILAYRKNKSLDEARKLSDEFGLGQGLYAKSDRDRYEALIREAQGHRPLEQVRDLFATIQPVVEKNVDPLHRAGVLRGLFLDLMSAKLGNKEIHSLTEAMKQGKLTLEVSGLGEYKLVEKTEATSLPDIMVETNDKAKSRVASDERTKVGTKGRRVLVDPTKASTNSAAGKGEATKVLGKAPRPKQAPTSGNELPIAAKGEGSEGPSGKISELNPKSRHQDPTRVGPARGDASAITDADAPIAGLLISSDGLDGKSFSIDEKKSVIWSSQEAGIPGKIWKVEIKPLGDGEFSIIPKEGEILAQAGPNWGPISRGGTQLQDGMRLRFGDIEWVYRKPSTEAARSLATGSRQAEENLAGNLLEYYADPQTKRSLDQFMKRQDAWAEQAGHFQKGLAELDFQLKNYHEMESEYRRRPTLEKRKALNEKWAEVENISSTLHRSRYHLMERGHMWSVKSRSEELHSLSVFFGSREFQALKDSRSFPEEGFRLHFHLDFLPPEAFPGKEEQWRGIPTSEFVIGRVEVSGWEAAKRLMQEMSGQEGLKVSEGLKIEADQKSGRAVVLVEGKHAITLEFRLADKTETASSLEDRVRSEIRTEYETLALLNSEILEMKAKLAETDPKKIEAMKSSGEYPDPVKIAEFEKILTEARRTFEDNLRAQHRTAGGFPYAEASTAQVGTANMPEGRGVATFKPVSEVEAKADKIARATPSPERIKRYAKYLVEKKKMSREDALTVAEVWAEQVIADARAYQAGRTHIYDTSLPAKPETAHMDQATVDHHGRFANPKNSTEQLIDRMEVTLDVVKGDREALESAAQDAASMDAARRGLRESGHKNPSAKQIQEIAAAIREMNLKEVTTDNLADGAWSVWIAKNQARILADPGLRKKIAEATHFEDFTAFGSQYDSKDPAVRLQAALFQEYGKILRDHGIVGSDRFTPDKARKVMDEALTAIDKMVFNPIVQEAAATEFFQKVEMAKKVALESALMTKASVHSDEIQLSFFDLTKLGEFTVFQQWLALPGVAPGGKADTLQVSVVPMKPLEQTIEGKEIKAGRQLQIVAIPNGRELPSQQGLLKVLKSINRAELRQAEALGLTPKEGEALKPGQLPREHFSSLWFGKDNVILPNPMKGGSLLSSERVSEILTDRAHDLDKLRLFEAPDRLVDIQSAKAARTRKALIQETSVGLPAAAASGPQTPLRIGEDSARSHSLPSAQGILETGDRSLPGAVLVPHQEGALAYPFTGYKNLSVVEVDSQAGIVSLRQGGSEAPLRFQYDQKHPPEFILKLKPGMAIDILHGGGGSAFPRGMKAVSQDATSAIGFDEVSINKELDRNVVSLSSFGKDAGDLSLFIGDPAKVDTRADMGIVVDDGANRGSTRFWGKLRHDGDRWFYYSATHPEAEPVRDAAYGTKAPRPDGWVELGEGDRINVGFADFQFRDGKLVHDDHLGALSLSLSLHRPEEIPGAARAATADYIDPVFTHSSQEPQMKILAGNVDFKVPIPVTTLAADSERGTIAMVTTQGKGYSKPNEDVVMSVRGPNGETVILDVDGMGGHGHGDAAAKLVGEAFGTEIPRSGDSQVAWQLANAAVRRFNGALVEGYTRDQALEFARQLIADPVSQIDKTMSKGSGAVAVQLRIDPPTKAGDPHVAHFEWVGDARGVIFRKDGQGRWQLGYRTVDQGVPNEPGVMVPGQDFEIGGGRRTLAMAVHPQANVVTNAIGSDAATIPQATQHGEIPNSRDPRGASEAGDIFSRGIALREGDLVILGSDGLWENFASTKALLEIIKDARSGTEVTQIMSDEAHWRMDILSQARRGKLPEEIPGLFRFDRAEGIVYSDLSGKVKRASTLFIDAFGNVYDSPNASRPVDHYKTDNFSMATYWHEVKSGDPRVLRAPDPKDLGFSGRETRNPSAPASLSKVSADLTSLDLKLTERRQRLSDKAKDLGEIQGSSKKYSPDEIAELLYQTLERGQPLELVTTGKGLRDAVDEYMVAFVQEFSNLFPQEIEQAKNRSPYTGESFVSRNQMGKEVQRYDALYRFARMRMNEKLGKPIFGEASFRQKVLVENFVSRALKKDGANYEAAKRNLREEFLNLGPDFQQAFIAANPALRIYLVSALVEDSWSHPVSDPDAAMRLVQFVGKTGIDREMGVAVDLSGEKPNYSLVLGNWDQISHPDKKVYLPIHSHTKFYLNQRGKVMGVQDTMVSALGKEIKRSAVVLPSDADLGYMGEFAKELSIRGRDVPPFFDAASKTLKGWVQHPYGIAEIRMTVDGQGNVTQVHVDYGFYDPKGVDNTHGERGKALQAWLGKKYPKAKCQFNHVEVNMLEMGMPGRKSEPPPAIDPHTAAALPEFSRSTAQKKYESFSKSLIRSHLAPILKKSQESGLEFGSLAIEVDGKLVTTGENFLTSHSTTYVAGSDHLQLFRQAVSDLASEGQISSSGTLKIYSFHTHPTRELASSLVRSPNAIHEDGRPYTMTNDVDWKSYQDLFRVYVRELRNSGWTGPIEMVAGAVPAQNTESASKLDASASKLPYVTATTIRVEAGGYY